MSETTREARAPVHMEVAYEDRGKQVFYPALNLSASGVFLGCPEPPEVGSEVRVVLSLPDNGLFLRLAGQVVRHAGKAEPHGFAVAFEKPDDRSRDALRSFVRSVASA